jgi:hypothetical protein
MHFQVIASLSTLLDFRRALAQISDLLFVVLTLRYGVKIRQRLSEPDRCGDGTMSCSVEASESEGFTTN